jgi:DNA polymerase-3 subunit beta
MVAKTQFALRARTPVFPQRRVLLRRFDELVATDGHRLALVMPRAGRDARDQAILPKDPWELSAAGVARATSRTAGENHLFFEVGGRLLISRMIDGQFPAYERVIPKGNDKHIEFERDRLTNAVKRVALLSNERSRAVKFQIEKGKVDVTSSSPEIGEAHETLPVDYTGDAMQICFNAQYVLDFLAAVTTDVVALELKDEVSQAVMMPVGAEGYEYTYVIMPMRV